MTDRVLCPRCKIDITGLSHCAMCGFRPDLVSTPEGEQPAAAQALPATERAEERMGVFDCCSNTVTWFGDFWGTVGWLVALVAIAGTCLVAGRSPGLHALAWSAFVLFWLWMTVDVVDQGGGLGWFAVVFYPAAIALGLVDPMNLWLKAPMAGTVIGYLLSIRE